MMSFFVFVVFSVSFWTLFLLADSSHPANLIIKLAGWDGAVAVEYWSQPTAWGGVGCSVGGGGEAEVGAELGNS